MKKTLKILLYFFATYHVLLGIIGILFVGYEGLVKKVASLAFNFNLNMDAQTIWMLKPLAAYMLALGLVGIFAADHPNKNKPAIYIIGGFILIRAIQRIIFALQGNEFLLNADPTRNMLVTIFLVAYGFSILYLAKKA